MLDVRRLRVLREVAVRGSFSAAAESLSFTQSAISQQIAALEREAGVVLVERNARGVRLTQAGGVIWFDSRIRSRYHSRATLRSLRRPQRAPQDRRREAS